MSIIYSVEDDLNIQNVIRIALTNSGHHVETFSEAAPMFERLKTHVPNLFLLDVMLPGMDGLAIVKQLKSRAEWAKVPIFIISAKTTEIDKVVGLDLGADDYLTKPFGVLELISRVKALLRRTETSMEEPVLNISGITLDAKERTCQVSGRELTLTGKEFALLKMLMANANKLITREEIMNTVWGYDFMGESRTLDVHIKELRQKLGNAGMADDLIETVRGVGYKFRT